MITGPTNVDPSILRALSKPSVLHTGAEFAIILRETLDFLRRLYMTQGDVFAVAGSGTLALEMAAANLLEPGDKVLNTVSGLFGQYFVNVSKAHGVESTVLEVPWGQHVKPESVREALSRDDYKAVTVTHVDTSTGIVNPIKEIGEVIRKTSDALYVVDSVCSLGGMEVRMDEWNIDICASGSQKCIGMPTGLALVAAGKKALESVENRKTPVSFWYGDFKNWLPVMRDPTRYFATPAVNMIYALHEALRILHEEGLEKRFMRHRLIGQAFRAGLEAIGVKLIAEKGFNAETVTAAYYPEKVQDTEFLSEMKRRRIQVLGTIGPLKGKGFRVGHMGNVTQNDIIATVSGIEGTLHKLGYQFLLGTGLKAAQEQLFPM